MARKGHKVKDVTGMQNIMFDLKPNRCEAEVFINEGINIKTTMGNSCRRRY